MAVKVRDLLNLVPDDILQQIGKDVCVDKCNQKLTGIRIFKVLLYSLAEHTRISLRTVERVYNSVIFGQFSGEGKDGMRHSSFANRLSKIKVDYFASIFQHLVDIYHDTLTEKVKNKIYRFDSTLISLSAKLFNCGLDCGGTPYKMNIKIVLGLKELIPTSVYFCSKRSEVNDDIALKNAISKAAVSKDDIIVFDRGLQAGKTYINFTKSGLIFVARIRTSRKYKITKRCRIEPEITEKNILSDEKILLWNSDEDLYFKNSFRLVKIKNPNLQDEIFLLTNNFILKAEEIAEIYRRRWDIEVFFKFIKQELNLKHFLVRNINGLMAYIYMILIFSILLLIYKKENSLSGFKFVKWDFFHELETEIISDIVTFCGGDPKILLAKYGLL